MMQTHDVAVADLRREPLLRPTVEDALARVAVTCGRIAAICDALAFPMKMSSLQIRDGLAVGPIGKRLPDRKR